MKIQITKKEFYRMGGLANPKCFRKSTKSRGWTYWSTIEPWTLYT